MANIFTNGNSCEEQDYLTELESLGVEAEVAIATGQELLSARRAIAQLRVEVRDLTNAVRRELQASEDWARIDTEFPIDRVP